jgi:non-canonical poly(A) RNA polymerase PAPD5/7
MYSLHQEVLDFTAWISPTKEEEGVRALVVKRIVDAVEAAFPQTRVSPFGSFKTKLYTPGAYPELISIEAYRRDIDLIVNWPGQSWTKSAMRRVAHAIERKGLGRNFAYIFSAKVRDLSPFPTSPLTFLLTVVFCRSQS